MRQQRDQHVQRLKRERMAPPGNWRSQSGQMKHKGKGPRTGLETPRCVKRSPSHSVTHCLPSLPPIEVLRRWWAKRKEGASDQDKVGLVREQPGLSEPDGLFQAACLQLLLGAPDGQLQIGGTRRVLFWNFKIKLTVSCLLVQQRLQGQKLGAWNSSSPNLTFLIYKRWVTPLTPS